MYKKIQKAADVSPAFDERRLAEATADLVSLAGGTIELTMLKRALYLGERAAIRETLRPIFGGRYRSEADTPVSAEFVELLQVEKPSDQAKALWLRHFNLSSGRVTVRNPVVTKALSRKDKGRLSAALTLISGQTSEQAALKMEAECPEWSTNSGDTYGVETILEALGHDAETVEKVLSNISYEAAVAARYEIREAG